MIVVEGPDGAGKTTLVAKLLNRYLFMREGPRGTKDRARLYTVTVPDTFGAINRAIRAKTPYREQRDICVWDRLFFSEMVYADLTDRPCQFSLGQQRFISRILEAIDCPIILCLPPIEVVEANALAAEQMKGVKENIAEIWSRYHSLYGNMPNNTMIYDYTGEDPDRVTYDEIIATIDKYLLERSKREW